MRKPDIPKDEKSRLKTLVSLNILDTFHEERFDRLTRMACKLFDVPIAMVTLVDDKRQWFKSCVGLNVSETARDISFCGHAILSDEVLVVSDAEKDARFADNPLVIGDPHIRFYAGCPIKSLNGSRLGTLGIIDGKARTLSKQDLDVLKDLASMVERELAFIELATIDELTGLSNRRGFMTNARYVINLCDRQQISCSLIFIDLNDFKKINDKFGHAEGDNALVDFSSLIKNNFRNSDILARLGGDEFVVLLTDTSRNAAEIAMNKLLKSVDEYYFETNHGYRVSFSYGIVEPDFNQHVKIEKLLDDADSLMYMHKSQK
jgi:diguanylate cyclase (GGDEF)-like protein